MSSTPWSKASFITKKGRLRLVVQTEKLRSRDPRATTTYISFFPLSLLTLSKTEMWKKCRLEKAFNLESQADFHWGKKGKIYFLKNSLTQNCHFPAPPISSVPILKQSLKFKACKSVEIDAIGIELAQQIKFSGCPTKDHLTAKNASLPLIAVKYPFVGQPDSDSC